ncbi:hypothetical protein R0131_00325 [Clostridium sp. AL.422]|uniref:hypothetical protein n=1 Tax=Clostridium TaxID=1485 RepID=UPI00293DC1C9|nr:MULTISPECIES: hypothetical protein [unclassified Clostridium]MDV4149273.1 hypothetical protein [Clostridium sp. AL.422]
MKKYQGKNSSYQLEVDKVKKVFHAEASGFFSEEDGISFLRDYDEITKTFPAKEYSLIIDAPELKPSSQEVAKILGDLLKKYMEVPFNKRFLVTKGNVITVSQFKRLGKEVPGWTESVKYVDNYNDALKAI